MRAMLAPVTNSDADVRRLGEAEFDRLTGAHGTIKRRTAAETEREMAGHRAAMDARCHEVKEWAQPIVDAATYSHRDALLRDLVDRRAALVGPLADTDRAMLKVAAIELWPSHARAHGFDVRAIDGPRQAIERLA